MPDESRDVFVPIRDENGRVTGVMDRATADVGIRLAAVPSDE